MKGEELEQGLEASKGREAALSTELQQTQGRLEVWNSPAAVIVFVLALSRAKNACNVLALGVWR